MNISPPALNDLPRPSNLVRFAVAIVRVYKSVNKTVFPMCQLHQSLKLTTSSTPLPIFIYLYRIWLGEFGFLRHLSNGSFRNTPELPRKFSSRRTYYDCLCTSWPSRRSGTEPHVTSDNIDASHSRLSTPCSCRNDRVSLLALLLVRQRR